jgi:SAM-dependent methyltransferase
VAVEVDFAYLRHVIAGGLVKGPVLEVGSRAWQGEEGNAARACRDASLEWEGTDIVAGEGVDFVLDILDRGAVGEVGRQWATVLVFNLLEHVYNPIEALENAMTLVAPGGSAVVIGPVVWQLHDYPRDFWRPMPDFFLEFADRNGLEVVPGALMWTVAGKLIPVERLSIGNQKKLPSISRPGVVEVWGAPQAYWSRALHTLLRTFGRETQYPDSGLGVVLRKPSIG